MGGTGRNATLAALLAEVGWSPYELARAVNRALGGTRRIHPTTPFTWRDRGVVPRSPLPSVIAGVLTEARGRSVTVEELWPDARPSTMYSAATAELDRPWSVEHTVGLLTELRSPGTADREYFALSGSDLIEVAQVWRNGNHPMLRARQNRQRVVTPELVGYLAADVLALRKLDDGHSGYVVMRAATYHLGLAIDLLTGSGYGAREGRQLASVVSQLAQLAGWLNFDLGNHGAAQRLYLLGLRVASLAGDRALGALVVSALSLQQSWRNRPQDSIVLLRLANAGLVGTPSPRVCALLAMREARSLAAAGERVDCRAALRSAQHALDHVSTEDGEPSWVYWLDQTVLTNEIGRCLLRLGETRPAQDHLNRGIGMIGDTPSRDRILYGLSLAHALTAATDSRQPDVEQACHEVRQVLPMMDTISSYRCRQLLGLVVSNLRGHRTASVRSLVTQVRETGRSVSDMP